MLLEILQRLQNEKFYWYIGFYTLVVAGFIHFLFIFLFIFLDIPQLIIVNIVSVMIYLYCIFGLGLKTLDSKDDSTIGWLVYFELIGHGSIATYYIGLESGFQYYIYTLMIIPFFVWTYTLSIRLLRMLGVIIIALLLEVWGNNNSPIIILDSNYITFLHYMNLILVLIIIAVISYFYTVQGTLYQNLLFEKSNNDPLTNLYNRRYVNETFENNILSSKMKGMSFALILIDIDYFKKINDIYGHKYGDKVLMKLSNILEQNVRESTIISRWGGEEFLVILEDTNKEELPYIAERLRFVVENTMMIEEKGISITITLGGAISRKHETFEVLLARADKALYRGKENGKNQVYIND